MIRKIYISNHIYLLYFYIFFVLTHFSIIDNVIQESDHSYSISVFLQDMSAYNDNFYLINYIIINSLIKKIVLSYFYNIKNILQWYISTILIYWKRESSFTILAILNTNTSEKAKLEKESFEIRQINIILTRKNTWERQI